EQQPQAHRPAIFSSLVPREVGILGPEDGVICLTTDLGVVVVDDPEVEEELAAAPCRDKLWPVPGVDQGQRDLELDDVTVGSAGRVHLPIGVAETLAYGVLMASRIGDELETLALTGLTDKE